MELNIRILKKEQLDLYKGYLSADALEQIDDPGVYSVGAFTDEKLVGVACFRSTNIPSVLSVAVSPDYQRNGIGSALIDHIAGLFIEKNIADIQAILFDEEGSADDLEYFLFRCGFMLAEEHPCIETELKNIVKVKEFVELIKKQQEYPDIVFLNKLDKTKKKNLGNLLRNRTSYRSFPEAGLQETLSVCFEQDDKPIGCVLLGEDGDILNLQYVYVSPECKNKMALLHMMTLSLEAAVKKYGLKKRMQIISTSDVTDKMIRHMFGDEADRQCFKRYIFSFSKETESSIEVTNHMVSASEYEGDTAPEEETGSFSEDPEFEQITNGDLICRDCVYRLYGAPVMICHKYSMKPDEVLNSDICNFYRKERRI